MNIVKEMRNQGNQQVVEKNLVRVTEKSENIVVITEETKELSNIFVKDLVGSFRAQKNRKYFWEDQPKETTFQSETNENSQNFSKYQQKKNCNLKKSGIVMILLRRLKKNVRKVLVFFVKFEKGTNHNEKNVDTKARQL